MDPQRARELLDAERRRLEALRDSDEFAIAHRSQEDSTSELTSFDQHPADVATETFEREKDLSIEESVHAQLREVEAAYARLEDGTYGVCQDGGERISDERLEAHPTARRCVEHQRLAERPA